VGFPSNEETIRAGAGPTKRGLKSAMKLGEGSVVVDPKAAPEMRAGVADLINFASGGCIAHRCDLRNAYSASFHELLELPLIIFGLPIPSIFSKEILKADRLKRGGIRPGTTN